MAYLQVDANTVIDTDAIETFVYKDSIDETEIKYTSGHTFYIPTKVVFQLLCDIHEVRGNLLQMSKVIEYQGNIDKLKKYYQDTYGGHKFIDLIKDPDKIIQHEEDRRIYQEFVEKSAKGLAIQNDEPDPQQISFNFNKKPKDVN